MEDQINRQAAIDMFQNLAYDDWNQGVCTSWADAYQECADMIRELPSAQLDEKLEKCRFEYINACRIVTFSTPDTTKKDISDAYAVIKALQPIFGDVTF